ncbi:hypothetical protein [Melghirimyces algeriensis]|uniref:Transcriptional regulator n=1 Tax=Melghirimyces algeriensis TaxID=910412 RepID=A0A521BH16_9BACL|nr:hypothetical protein [Melghirimyces algeriensis]SMO46372.1 hypothetical protein SAMN06264849_10282 [Melghirimyces algeriensis]
MKTRLGILGPEDSVDRIREVAEKMKDLELAFFPYTQVVEAEELIRNNRHRVDHWFLSGPAVYRFLIKKGLLSPEEASYPALYGSSLMGILLEAFTVSKKPIHRVGLDTIRPSEIDSVRKDFHLENVDFVLYPKETVLPAEDVIDFHMGLYEKGQTDVVLTCIKTVYLALKENGVPCFRVSPSRLGIELELRYIREYAQARWYRKSSLGMVGVEVPLTGNTENHSHYSYRLKRQLLDLKRFLLEYSEMVQGSFSEVGDGLFFIYTTRGELELKEKEYDFSRVCLDMEKQTGLPVRLGIGYGMTAWEAEQNVRQALLVVQKEDRGTVVLVDEESEVTLFKEEQTLSYRQRFSGTEWSKQLKAAKISPAVIDKIVSYYHYYEKDSVTANEIATWLKSTVRNARRILSELERLNLVKVVGEEQSGRGRPRKRYELLVKDPCDTEEL